MSFNVPPSALWARITKNTDWSTEPLARPFVRLLAPLTGLLALLCFTLGGNVETHRKGFQNKVTFQKLDRKRGCLVPFPAL